METKDIKKRNVNTLEKEKKMKEKNSGKKNDREFLLKMYIKKSSSKCQGEKK